ncbi:protein kinase-like protein [Xylariomycetidae sp. FL0641]|nr:protein kinase-like protein [Xylariomycetidae sp. FL0641]
MSDDRQSYQDDQQFLGWAFDGYRTNGRRSVNWNIQRQQRPFWQPRRLPLPGRPNIAYERSEAQPRQVRAPAVQRDINTRGPRRPNDAPFEAIRSRLREARRFFRRNSNLTFVKGLGYGGRGIAVVYEDRTVQPPTKMIIKVNQAGWDDDEIRKEKEALRKVRRAAHCVQMIPPGDALPDEPDEFRFPEPSWSDSSEEQDSSGDESRDEQPPAKRPRRRRSEAEKRNRDDYLAQRNAAREVRYDKREAARGAPPRRRRMRLRSRPDADESDDENEDYDLNRKDFLLLEFLENGDLHNFLLKVIAMQERIPNRVLWAFWLCMIRACVAMEYPPNKFHPQRRDPPPADQAAAASNDNAWKRIGDDLYEDIPPARRRWAAKRMVHFDIDPKNILIGEHDPQDQEHRLVPRLKLADFGLATSGKRNKRNVYYTNRRWKAKYGYYAPEQFGPEWDHVNALAWDGPELSEQMIAGNYGSHTNVWGIALTMWQLMTGLKPPTPPQSFCHDGSNRSYAIWLNNAEYEHIDQELKDIVTRCMYHDPRSRPSLQQLLATAKQRQTKHFDGETDRMIDDWLGRVLYGAQANSGDDDDDDDEDDGEDDG